MTRARFYARLPPMETIEPTGPLVVQRPAVDDWQGDVESMLTLQRWQFDAALSLGKVLGALEASDACEQSDSDAYLAAQLQLASDALQRARVHLLRLALYGDPEGAGPAPSLPGTQV